MNETTICIVEDDESIRTSLLSFIEAKTLYKVLDVFESVEDFMSSDYQPSILLLDIGLPGVSGLDGLPIIKKKFPELDIIMLTTYQEVDIIFKALSIGACSYISKRTPLPKIIEALHIVAGGGSYMSPSIARKIADRMQGINRTQKISLTDQQKKIISLIIDGKKYSEIAHSCDITINTVRFHIKKIYNLLEINSKVQLYKKYIDGEI